MTALTHQPSPQPTPCAASTRVVKVAAAVLLLVAVASADGFAGVATATHQHGTDSDATDVVFEDIAGHASLVSDPTAVATAAGSSAEAVGGTGSADRVGGSERPAAPVGRGGGLSGFAGLTPPVRVPIRRSWEVRDVCRSRFATAQLGDPASRASRARPRRAPATAGRGMAFRATCAGRDSPFVRIHAGAEVVREVVGDWHRTWWLSPALDAPVGYTIACEAADCSSPPALLSADDALGTGETSASFFPVQTFRRDVGALADASGSIVEAYRYDVFGTPEVVSPSAPNPWSDANALAGAAAAGAGGARSTYGNTMLWAGAHWRPELRLYNMRARQYDPAHGLFLSPDPLGYVDSFDEWLFAGGDPFGGWDPFGLREQGDMGTPHHWEPPFLHTVNMRTWNSLGNFGAGLGDGFTLGLSRWSRERLGYGEQINTQSGSYESGWWTGTGAILGAMATVAPVAAGGRAVVGAGAMGSSLPLIAPAGPKLGQQIARFRSAGGVGSRSEYLQYANELAARAREAGTFVTGTVGRGTQSVPNATIFREGRTFLVVDEFGVIRSYVPKASPGGVVSEYIRLGGGL